MIAYNTQHYFLSPHSLSFTRRGLEDLTFAQRQQIEIAFRYGRLGDEYEFPEYTEIYEDFPVDADWPEGTIYELSPAAADKQHEDEKARRERERIEWGSE